MTVTVTPADVKGRFPAFDGVADDVVQGAIDEAARRVDASWPDDDARLGLMLYAAHILTLDGHGGGADAAAATMGPGWRRMKVGSLELERSDSGAAGGSVDVLSATSYGRRFADLVRRLFPAVLAI